MNPRSNELIDLLSKLKEGTHLTGENPMVVMPIIRQLNSLKPEDCHFDIRDLSVEKSDQESLEEYVARCRKLPLIIKKRLTEIEESIAALDQAEIMQNQFTTKTEQKMQQRTPLPPYNPFAQKKPGDLFTAPRNATKPPVSSPNLSPPLERRGTGMQARSTNVAVPSRAPVQKKLPKTQTKSNKQQNNLPLIKQKLVEAKQKLIQSQNEIEPTMKKELTKVVGFDDNAVVIRIWHRNRENAIFGQDTSHHISIEVNKNGERHFLSFYPDKTKNTQLSAGSRFLKFVGLPSADSRPSKVITSIEEDLYRLYIDDEEMKYQDLETIVIMDKNGSFLNLNAIIAWMEREAAHPRDFSFYTQNCAKVGLEALQAGGAEKIVPINLKSKFVVMPIELAEYAKKLNEKIAQAKKLSRTSIVRSKQTYLKSLKNYIEFFTSKLTYDSKNNTIKYLIDSLSTLSNQLAQLVNDKDIILFIEKLYPGLIEVKKQIDVDNDLDSSVKREILSKFDNLISTLPNAKQIFLNRLKKQTNLYIESERDNLTLTNTQIAKTSPEFAIITFSLEYILAPIDNVNNFDLELYKIKLKIQNTLKLLKKQMNKLSMIETEEAKSILSLYKSMSVNLKSMLREINLQLFFADEASSEDQIDLKTALAAILFGKQDGFNNYPTVDQILEDAIDIFKPFPHEKFPDFFAELKHDFSEILKSETSTIQKLKAIHTKVSHLKKHHPLMPLEIETSLADIYVNALSIVVVKGFVNGHHSEQEIIGVLTEASKNLSKDKAESLQNFLQLMQTRINDYELMLSFDKQKQSNRYLSRRVQFHKTQETSANPIKESKQEVDPPRKNNN